MTPMSEFHACANNSFLKLCQALKPVILGSETCFFNLTARSHTLNLKLSPLNFAMCKHGFHSKKYDPFAFAWLVVTLQLEGLPPICAA